MTRTRRILQALDLLATFEPLALDHLVTEAREIVFAPAFCSPDAIACTGGPHGRRIVLVQDPLSMDLVELAATLFHESLHLASDRFGNLVTIPHDCVDCRNFIERARDWIYAEEAALETRLRRATGIRRPSTGNVGKALGALAVGALLGVAIGTAAVALSNRA